MGIILIGILAFAIYTLYTNGTITVKSPKLSSDALLTLSNRFITGEIDEATYQKMKQILKS